MKKYKADLNFSGYNNESPLRFGLTECCYRGVDLLIKHGADTTFINHAPQPPLFQVVARKYNPGNCQYKDAIRGLISYGANINGRDEYGDTPLIEAIDNDNSETANILLDLGANINLKDKKGKTALDHAQKKGMRDIVKRIGSLRAKIKPPSMSGQGIYHVKRHYTGAFEIQIRPIIISRI